MLPNWKRATCKSQDLYPEGDELLSKAHLTPGRALMLEENGKAYPVQFVSYSGNYILWIYNIMLWRIYTHACTVLQCFTS